MEWRDEEESVARGTGYSTGGRKNCWEQAGQLIFYKPGLERSWNEEWEKDSWESATGIRSEKEWDSWITLPLIRNICTFRGRERKNGERWERKDCILLHLFASTGFSLTYYLCLASFSALISLSLLWKDHTGSHVVLLVYLYVLFQ